MQGAQLVGAEGEGATRGGATPHRSAMRTRNAREHGPTTPKLTGAAVAIGGVTLYSLAKALSVGQKEKKVVTLEVEAEPPGTWQP